jgi:hypothetical protein
LTRKAGASPAARPRGVSSRHVNHPEVAFIPSSGMPPARVALVWRRDNDKHKVIEFANLAGR